MSDVAGGSSSQGSMSEVDPLADLTFRAPSAPSAAVSDAICRHCTKGTESGRGASAGKRILLSLLVATPVIGLALWAVAAHGGTDLPLEAALYGGLGWAVVQAFVLVAGLGRPPGRRPAATLRLVIAVLVPVAFLGYVAATSTGVMPFGEFVSGESGRHVVRCGLASLFLGALVSGGVLLLWRRTDPLTPGLSGALVGLVGGLSGGVTMGIACPSHEAWHACFAHGLTVVGLVALGGAMGRRLLAP